MLKLRPLIVRLTAGLGRGINQQAGRAPGSSYPVRQSPQMASKDAVPEVVTLRPSSLQEVCGRQSSESSEFEKLPVGHD